MAIQLRAALLLSLAVAACGGGSSSPSSPSATFTGPVDVTGTWVEVRGSLNLFLTQNGSNVTGSATFSDRNDVFGSYRGDGPVTGTVSGTTMTLTEVYGISGATSGRDTKNCTETVNSTWTVTSATSMNGPFTQVDVCDGAEVFRKSGTTTVEKR
ncbi:MAG TPA: hypothetical protein VG871_01640 [Vicinamibacterales bacterium]|nr:hypothetical protein [Vicinamibacterales bacterium]